MEPSLVATVATEPPLAATVATELPLAAMERLPAATLGRLVELETLAAGVPLQTEAMTALRAGGGAGEWCMRMVSARQGASMRWSTD